MQTKNSQHLKIRRAAIYLSWLESMSIEVIVSTSVTRCYPVSVTQKTRYEVERYGVLWLIFNNSPVLSNGIFFRNIFKLQYIPFTEFSVDEIEHDCKQEARYANNNVSNAKERILSS